MGRLDSSEWHSSAFMPGCGCRASFTSSPTFSGNSLFTELTEVTDFSAKTYLTSFFSSRISLEAMLAGKSQECLGAGSWKISASDVKCSLALSSLDPPRLLSEFDAQKL